MQLAAPETHITVQQRLYHQRRDVRVFQVQRSGSAFIESAVHCHERFAGSGNVLATKAPCGGQTSVQTEGNELRLADSIPVRQTTYVAEHQESVPGADSLRGLRRGRLERRPAGMNARPTTPGKALLRGDEALADSKEDEFGGAVDIHFLHKVGAVHRNCVDAEVEKSGDILV